MQPRPFNRQQLRRTAAVMLVAWVFALCSGVAHACLLSADSAMGTPALALSAGAPAMHLDRSQQGTLDHVHPVTGHHDGAPAGNPADDSGKDACLKFCADESSALTKDKGSPADPAASQPLAFVPRQPPALRSLPGARQPAEGPAQAGPLLFLRLLRLTI